MKKNTASQVIGAQMVSATDGSAFTGAVTVYVTGDAGVQAAGSVGSGACTHEGNGYHTYAPAQAETNYDLIAFTFTGSGAVPATVQVFTGFPQTGDNYARLGAPAGASVSADVAAVKSDTAAVLEDTGTTLDTLIKDVPTVAEFEARTLLAADYVVVGDTLAAVTTVGSVTGAVGSVTGAVGSVTGAVTVGTNNDKTGYALTAAYDAAKTAATQASVDDLPTNAEFALRTLPSADYVVVTDTLARVTLVDTTTTNTDMVAAAPSAATVADAVWDEALAGHVGVGSAGAGLAAAGSAGDPWSTALPGAYGAGTAGKMLSDIEAVAPDNKPTVSATGEASTNVTYWAGVAAGAAPATVADLPAAAPSAADIKTALEADGSKLDHLWEMTADDGGVRQFTANALELASSGSGLTAQETANAVHNLAPAGVAAAGSLGAKMDAKAEPGDPMTIARRP